MKLFVFNENSTVQDVRDYFAQHKGGTSSNFQSDCKKMQDERARFKEKELSIYDKRNELSKEHEIAVYGYKEARQSINSDDDYNRLLRVIIGLPENKNFPDCQDGYYRIEQSLNVKDAPTLLFVPIVTKTKNLIEPIDMLQIDAKDTLYDLIDRAIDILKSLDIGDVNKKVFVKILETLFTNNLSWHNGSDLELEVKLDWLVKALIKALQEPDENNAICHRDYVKEMLLLMLTSNVAEYSATDTYSSVVEELLQRLQKKYSDAPIDEIRKKL
ncbi:MAG: hypothetical protein IJ661_03950 [Lachnospiraceae bacterium]|nr:hypothetical protein [Lachnospiraceae bacterium]